MNNETQEDYCSFEVSKLLKEKGFNVPCYNYYSFDKILEKRSYGIYNTDRKGGGCSRPTHALAIKWIRENFKHDIYLICPSEVTRTKWIACIIEIGKLAPIYACDMKNSPEEAVEAALLYTLQKLIP